MNNETSISENPIGIYRHKESRTEVGCLHPAQADAAVRLGFVLVKEHKTIKEVEDSAREVKEAPVAPTPAAAAPAPQKAEAPNA